MVQYNNKDHGFATQKAPSKATRFEMRKWPYRRSGLLVGVSP